MALSPKTRAAVVDRMRIARMLAGFATVASGVGAMLHYAATKEVAFPYYMAGSAAGFAYFHMGRAIKDLESDSAQPVGKPTARKPRKLRKPRLPKSPRQ